MVTRQALLEEAMGLSPEERELLAIEIHLSIPKAPGYDAAWAAEIERRLAAVASGEADEEDWEVAEPLIFEG